MGLIKYTEPEDDVFIRGKLFVPLFGSEIEVYIEENVTPEYAERCAKHLTELSDEMIDDFCERAIRYYEYMLDEWEMFEAVSHGVLDDIKSTMPEKVTGREILKYISSPSMFIFEPKEDVEGYSVECRCVWEPEHGLDLIIRGDKILYVADAMALGPWCSDDEYECVF